MLDKIKYKITKLLPVADIWIRNEDDNGFYYYDKAICLVLIEWNDKYHELCQAIQYLCKCDIEFIDLESTSQSQQNIFFTHELPDKMIKDKNELVI